MIGSIKPKHRRPFAEQHQLAVTFGCQLFEQFGESLQFAAVSRFFLVHQIRAVAGHAGHQQVFLQPQQIHLREVLLAGDLGSSLDVFLAHDQLFFGGPDAYDFGAAFGQLLHHAAARAAQQDRLEGFAQLVQVAIALDTCPVRRPRGGGERSDRLAPIADRR